MCTTLNPIHRLPLELVTAELMCAETIAHVSKATMDPQTQQGHGSLPIKNNNLEVDFFIFTEGKP